MANTQPNDFSIRGVQDNSLSRAGIHLERRIMINLFVW